MPSPFGLSAHVLLPTSRPSGFDVGTTVRWDPAALTRLVEGVERLAQVVNHTPEGLNMPFLSATEKGPVHLDERITLARYQELAARPFVFEPRAHPTRPVAREVTSEVDPAPKKKKWFFF